MPLSKIVLEFHRITPHVSLFLSLTTIPLLSNVGFETVSVVWEPSFSLVSVKVIIYRMIS